MSQPNADIVISAFNGALVVRNFAHAKRTFAFEVTFLEGLGSGRGTGSQKPPLHFHPHQEEYVEVLEGNLIAEVEGREYLLSPDDGEFRIDPWKIHRLYQPIDTPHNTSQPGNIAKFILSAQNTPTAYKLDAMFFQNWYGYMDEIALTGEKMNLIQAMCMFDAGGSYFSLPRWIPLNKWIAWALGIAMGRWLGGILGYQPFYRKWTTDWQLACEKMSSSIIHRRFVDTTRGK